MTNFDPNVVDSIFGDMATQKEKTGGGKQPKLPAGTHTVALFDFKQAKSDKKGPFFAVRYVAVKSNNPAVTIGSIYGEAFFVGPQVDYPDSNKKRLRNFIRACAALPDSAPPAEINAAGRSMLAAGNPARGMQIKVIGIAAKSESTGNEYAQLTYEEMPQDNAAIAKMRQWIDGVEEGNDDLLERAAKQQTAAAPAQPPQAPAQQVSPMPAPATFSPPQGAVPLNGFHAAPPAQGFTPPTAPANPAPFPYQPPQAPAAAPAPFPYQPGPAPAAAQPAVTPPPGGFFNRG